MFKVLAADKLLRDQEQISCRPTPTPPGLSSDICGVCVELLDRSQLNKALELLEADGNPPSGRHEVP
jgi:hypothetical protein